MEPINILIIGGGNMGRALAHCWRDLFNDVDIAIAEANAETRAQLQQEGFYAPDEIDLPEGGYDVVLLAVKPQSFSEIANEITDVVGDATLISIMAGVKLETLKRITPNAVRVMPNTPAVISEGMSVICAPGLEEARLHLVEDLFLGAGEIATIDDEAQMHTVTAISGSGPAYLFAFMEALEKAALANGLNAELANQLVRQTMRGAGMLASQSGDIATLRQQVTSPGGTTEAALKALENGGLERMVSDAVNAAQSRSQSLS